jgi:hypothetical protein
MTGIPPIQFADVTEPYYPESGDIPAPDHGSHGVREDDLIEFMKIRGNLNKDREAVIRATRDPGIAGYAHHSIRPDDGRNTEES